MSPPTARPTGQRRLGKWAGRVGWGGHPPRVGGEWEGGKVRVEYAKGNLRAVRWARGGIVAQPC